MKTGVLSAGYCRPKPKIDHGRGFDANCRNADLQPDPTYMFK